MSDDHTADPYFVTAPDAIPEPGPPALSSAEARFLACRWHKPAETGTLAHCTHRDVLPMAGAAGFSAESWCADCAYFKVKRVVRRPAPFV
jgi:hypothetical protein